MMSSRASQTASPVLGVLIPCRNEERVIGRKLANLALARWPRANSRHRICVVDDGSTDATLERAREVIEELFGGREDIEASVVVNDLRPGKSGAMTRGIESLEGVELLVLTDADVVLHPKALIHLALAFSNPAIGMASGSQAFVEGLAEDGSARGPGGAALIGAAGFFDCATAVVRSLESRFGRLFSVHGQLLAWRAELALLPTPGIAADDLDLAFLVRARGHGVCLVREAKFFEGKTAPGPAADAQALRRARAFVQVVSKPGASIGTSWPDRLQFFVYRRLAPLLPESLLLVVLGLLVGALSAWGEPTGYVLLGGLLLFTLTPAGRRTKRLCSIIRQARRHEQSTSISDRWEMERT